MERKTNLSCARVKSNNLLARALQFCYQIQWIVNPIKCMLVLYVRSSVRQPIWMIIVIYSTLYNISHTQAPLSTRQRRPVNVWAFNAINPICTIHCINSTPAIASCVAYSIECNIADEQYSFVQNYIVIVFIWLMYENVLQIYTFLSLYRCCAFIRYLCCSSATFSTF